MVTKEDFIDTLYEMLDELNWGSIEWSGLDEKDFIQLLKDAWDRTEKHSAADDAPRCVLCRGEIEKTPRTIALCDACILRQTVEQYATTLKNVMAKKSALKDKVERLQMAVGLATTAVPTMEMDSDHPVEMMQSVVAEVERLRAERDALRIGLQTADDQWRAMVAENQRWQDRCLSMQTERDSAYAIRDNVYRREAMDFKDRAESAEEIVRAGLRAGVIPLTWLDDLQRRKK